MQLNRLITEKRAVSPVIGVILMVAITVILAAVVGSFVLGIAADVSETSPNAQISFDYDTGEGTVVLTHDGGSSFQANDVRLAGIDEPESVRSGAWEAGATIRAGDATDPIQLDEGSGGNTLRLVWEGGSGSGSVIARSTIPSGI